jgi:hypothetical protein
MSANGEHGWPALHIAAMEGHAVHPQPWNLHPTPFTLHPTPYTLHPTPHALHPTPHTLNDVYLFYGATTNP